MDIKLVVEALAKVENFVSENIAELCECVHKKTARFPNGGKLSEAYDLAWNCRSIIRDTFDCSSVNYVNLLISEKAVEFVAGKLHAGSKPEASEGWKNLPEYNRMRVELETVSRLGHHADIDSAMLNVDVLCKAVAANSIVDRDAKRYQYLRSLKSRDHAHHTKRAFLVSVVDWANNLEENHQINWWSSKEVSGESLDDFVDDAMIKDGLI